MAPEAEKKPKLTVEPFDPAKHDRTAFSSGTKYVDNFLKISAKKFQKGKMTRYWVGCLEGTNEVVAYYAINAHNIDASDLGDQTPKGVPNHGEIPSIYIAAIGINVSLRGKGYGSALLAHALKKIKGVSEVAGCWAAVLDVLDDGNHAAIQRRKKFYEDRGFVEFPSTPLRMFLPVKNMP